MDITILTELARSWRARSERQVRDGSPDAVEFNARMDGSDEAREQCAKELEQIISIYAPLDQPRDRVA